MPAPDATGATPDTSTLMHALTIVAAANDCRTTAGVPGHDFCAALLLFAACTAPGGTEDGFVLAARQAWREVLRQGAP